MMFATLTGVPAVLLAAAAIALVVAIDAYRWHRIRQARARGQTSPLREWILRTPTAPLIVGAVFGLMGYLRVATGAHSNHDLAVGSGIVFGVAVAAIIALAQYRRRRSDPSGATDAGTRARSSDA